MAAFARAWGSLSNTDLVMRLLTGAGTPREFLARASAWLVAIVAPDSSLIVLMFVTAGDQSGALAINIRPNPFG